MSKSSAAKERRIAAGILAFCVVSFSWCQNPPTTQKSLDRVYDIEVTRTISNSCAESDLYLTAGNFIVSQGNRKFKLCVSQPVNGGNQFYAEIAKRLLIVFPAGSARPSQESLLTGLNRAIRTGWAVRASRPDGGFTPYETDFSALSKDLAVGIGSASSQDRDDAAIEAAIEAAADQLSWFPGRRALIVAAPQTKSQRTAGWFSRQASVFSMLYVIDGGVKVEYSGADFGWKGVSADLAVEKTLRVFGDGLYHEVSFADTIKDLISDSHCNYDIQFQMPAINQQTEAPVDLLLHHAGVLQSLRAEIYALEGNGSTRVQVPQKLRVTEK